MSRTHTSKVAKLELRILNIQVAHLKVRLMTMCKKCHVIHEDRQQTINNVCNILGLSYRKYTKAL